MISRVLTVSILAGLCAGLLVSALQHVTTTPLIVQAETYEAALRSGFGAMQAAFEGEARIVLAHADTSGEAWKPHDGLERTAFTSLVTIATAIAFAALLLAGMLAANERIDDRRALLWAACAFFAFGLAPAAGLAPELPGSAAAELTHRQAWWALTAALTAAGLFVFLRMESPWLRVLGLLLLVVPHVIGAPHPAAPESKVPAEVAAHFAALSLGVQASLWLLTGLAVGVLWPWATRRAGAR